MAYRRAVRAIRKIIGTCIVAFILAPALSSADPVKIGVITPLTGGLSDRGEEVQRTVRAFQKTYLDSSLNNQFQFIFEDGRNGIGSSALTAARKLIDLDGVRFLITTTSGETIQAGKVANNGGIVTIGVLATVPEIRSLGDYVFRTYMDIEDGLIRLLEDLNRRADNYALISEEAPFTDGIKKILVKISGSRVAAIEEFAPDSQDFRAILLRVKAAQPAALYLNCSSPTTFVPLLRQVKQLGLSQPIYSYFMPAEPAVEKSVGELLEGIRFIDTPRIEEGSTDVRRFFSTYRELYPDGPKVHFVTRSTHDALKALIDSISAVGPSPDKVKDYLYKIRFAGALGEVSFDDVGDVRGLRFSLMQVLHGRVEPLSSK